MTTRRHDRCQGLTIVELVVVMTILIALAGVVVPNLMQSSETSREVVADASAIEIRDAVMQFWSDCKYAFPQAPITDQRIQLGHLLEMPTSFGSFTPFDREVRLGWNGPYLQIDGKRYLVDASNGFTTTLGDASQFAVRDVYINQDYNSDGNADSGSPFVIQEPTLVDLTASGSTYSIGQLREVRVVSAGPNGTIDIDESRFASELEANPALKGDDIYVSFTLR
ncbi:MAG: type II secretion system protein [Planctomycetota bacterium]